MKQRHRFKIKLNRSCNDKIDFFIYIYIFYIYLYYNFQNSKLFPVQKYYLLNWTALMASSFQTNVIRQLEIQTNDQQRLHIGNQCLAICPDQTQSNNNEEDSKWFKEFV